MATSYYLTDSEPPHPVRVRDGETAEVMDIGGDWNRSSYYDAGRFTGEIAECSEGAALAAAAALIKAHKKN